MTFVSHKESTSRNIREWSPGWYSHWYSEWTPTTPPGRHWSRQCAPRSHRPEDAASSKSRRASRCPRRTRASCAAVCQNNWSTIWMSSSPSSFASFTKKLRFASESNGWLVLCSWIFCTFSSLFSFSPTRNYISISFWVQKVQLQRADFMRDDLNLAHCCQHRAHARARALCAPQTIRDPRRENAHPLLGEIISSLFPVFRFDLTE